MENFDLETAQLQVAAMQAQKAAQVAQKALADRNYTKQQAAITVAITKLQADIAEASAS